MKDSITNLNAATTAAILQALDYSPDTISKRMKDVFGKGPDGTIEIIQGLGYSLLTQVRILYEEFNRGVNSITSILTGNGYSPEEVAAAIFQVLGV